MFTQVDFLLLWGIIWGVILEAESPQHGFKMTLRLAVGAYREQAAHDSTGWPWKRPQRCPEGGDSEEGGGRR